MLAIPWWILLAPLISLIVITLFTRRSRSVSAGISIAAAALGFVLSLVLLARYGGGAGGSGHGDPTFLADSFRWLSTRIGDRAIDFRIGVLIDPLSILMLLVVTGVGSAIHVYSLGYMKGDSGWSRYFASMSLFMFSMLGIVLSDNFIQIFIFWELVGVSSYALIGFWYERPAAADAGKKAFLTNKVGDFGFLLGILAVWVLSGAGGDERTLSFVELGHRFPDLVAHGHVAPGILALAGVLVFSGAVGKSAQFPLHVWLPDAMEGPTPVSALIHAATMVAAGVFMLARVFFLFAGSAVALEVIAIIGAVTAVMAALIAVVQTDIKRVLAFSTLSQLGYMVLAIGVAAPIAAMYHLTTHAFFKALLFLGAGSVILGLHHEQDIRRMGGLLRRMPVTGWTFLVGTLALCGVPPLSGFYSKDEIVLAAFDARKIYFVVAAGTAFLTAFYMGRLFTVAFLGRFRGDHEPHESPRVMTMPLVFLAVLTVVGGFLGIPGFLHHLAETSAHHGAGHHDGAGGVIALSIGVALAGLALGYLVYGTRWIKPERLRRLPVVRQAHFVLRHKFFFDEIYRYLLVGLVQQGTAWVCSLFERLVIMGAAVGGVASGTRAIGRGVRRLQTGNVQTYGFLVALGMTLILYLILVRGAP